MAERDLEVLYREAQAALKAKDYARASELLKQILLENQDYKDVSRLLAQVVDLRRRRWYNHPILWSTVAAAVVLVLGFAVAPRVREIYASQIPASTPDPTGTSAPTDAPNPTETPAPTPTSIPLAWKRVSLGQDFQRDIVRAIAVNPKDPDVIYAGLANAGVYKSIDGGLSWQPSHRGLDSTEIYSLVIDPTNPNRLYAGTNAGTYQTTDGGLLWKKVGPQALQLWMDPDNPSHVIGGWWDTIFETRDAGKTWTDLLNSECPQNPGPFAVDPSDNKRILLSERDGGDCTAGLYESLDGGRTFQFLAFEDAANISALVISSESDGTKTIYAMTGFNRLSISRDNGATWSTTSLNCTSFTIGPENPAIAYCSGWPTGIYRTRDSGKNWDVLNQSLVSIGAIHADQYANKTRLLAGGYGIVQSLDNGASWSELSNGIGTLPTSLAVDPTKTGAFYLGVNGLNNVFLCWLFHSGDGGRTWQELLRAEGSWCGPTIGAESDLYIIDHYWLIRSVDGGNTWRGTPNQPPWTYSNLIAANPFVPGLIYAGTWNEPPYLFYSSNYGGTWQPVSGINSQIWNPRLFFAPGGQRVYAVNGGENLYRSNDSGINWNSCPSPSGPGLSDSGLVIDPRDQERLLLATAGDGVYYSSNGCATWDRANDGLGNLFVNTLALDPNHPDTVYAGTDGGAYVSFDFGQTWHQINDGLLGATVVYSIVVDKDSNVYAATPYGIFKLESK